MLLGRDEMSPFHFFVRVVLLAVFGAVQEFGFAQCSVSAFDLVARQ